MVIVELSEYLNCDTSVDGDIAEIMDEGSYSDIEDKATKKKKKVLNIGVKVNDKELIYTPAKKTLRLFAKAWGTDSANWVGHKFQIAHVNIEAFGKEMRVIRARPFE